MHESHELQLHNMPTTSVPSAPACSRVLVHLLQAYMGLPPSRSAAAPFAGGFDDDDVNPVAMPEGVIA